MSVTVFSARYHPLARRTYFEAMTEGGLIDTVDRRDFPATLEPRPLNADTERFYARFICT
ncbi:hypothetical protein [Pseudonocardia alaniniphila]|uniref:Uncharacterized protein n=1 Tax=Pseudonocardia alaniniphila TaxID=75291 RepID=A0ABS9TD00_9PSEU|nr:hypothetical protein [Pseudonocardia alaniniphila]MCH6166410.1 hypothetical protein [Pseudonocardia alaniniphila]